MCPLRAFGGVHGVAGGGRLNRERRREGHAYAGRHGVDFDLCHAWSGRKAFALVPDEHRA